MTRMKKWDEITSPLSEVDKREISAFVVSMVAIGFIAGLMFGVAGALVWRAMI